jgi:hypothetical protein
MRTYYIFNIIEQFFPLEKNNQEKRDHMGEETRETQKVVQEPTNPNGEYGNNPCKPKTTLIPKVILEDP